jgi:anti-anti-sigma factor
VAEIRVVGDDVVLVGEIDIAAREQVPAVVAQLNAAARLVTIDISGVTFIDGAGLDALVSIAEAAVAGGATVRYGTSRWVTRYLDLTDTALPVGSMR